ncbi:uncharacterized protein BP01DRAFT_384258 [Aspergillus saccharolyticus JOP 1030-1]|uniref:Uncharacterized protein n=1 Tax=Aspergillus saccharolyticus JOP 1030-1 TaxID=1450539 RepID=A0A318ZIR4_9EURO|nr:hypothetical protein BP01DRAFT_384258 [Aspergillus saccharolyticus JOP 1030-1]PYH43600.1 hypothetical protein BP01DRAFT_384258 [Aspergillus saccharolyticus JOP 1030-1]
MASFFWKQADPSLTRVKLGGIHRAQPYSHSYEAGTDNHYFLAKWASLLGFEGLPKDFDRAYTDMSIAGDCTNAGSTDADYRSAHSNPRSEDDAPRFLPSSRPMSESQTLHSPSRHDSQNANNNDEGSVCNLARIIDSHSRNLKTQRIMTPFIRERFLTELTMNKMLHPTTEMQKKRSKFPSHITTNLP